MSNQSGARVLIMRNEIRQHGQHGLLLSGPQEAVVLDNRFVENGTQQFRPVTPRPAAGRQGHHIFVQGKSGVANSLLIAGNTMQRAFADGLALVVFFDEADGVSIHARGFCRGFQFLGQNPKIGCQQFNDLQTSKLPKK